LLGEYTMHSFGEYPSEERGSRLSQILEDSPLPKYSLSEKACIGIMKRAEKRGKSLPTELKDALVRQASLSRSGGGVEVDSAGKKAGKGPLVQTELSGTLGVSQDQTLITLADEEKKKAYGISSFDSNAMKSANPNSGIYEAETSRTLDNNGGNPACNQGGVAVVQAYGFDGGKSADARTLGYEKEKAGTVVQNPNHVLIEKNKTIFGEDVAPTLVASMTTPVGKTQDKLLVVTEQKDEDGEH
jgi:hypothetical protein